LRQSQNFPDIIKDDSKYQVKPNEYFAKFAKPMNNSNGSGEKPEQAPPKKQQFKGHKKIR
jgi:hypothetical protein